MGMRHKHRRIAAWASSADAKAAIKEARAGRCARAFRHLMVMRGDEGAYGAKHEKAYTAAALIYDHLCHGGKARKEARGGHKYDISALQGAKRKRRRGRR